MPPYFKDKFFEGIQMILCGNITQMFFIPYVLAMDVLYNKCWCCLRSDYIIHNILSNIYPLLWLFKYIVVGREQYYVLLLAHYVTARRDWTIRAVCIMIPELTYHQWQTILPVVRLVTKVPRGSSDTVPRAEVLTY